MAEIGRNDEKGVWILQVLGKYGPIECLALWRQRTDEDWYDGVLVLRCRHDLVHIRQVHLNRVLILIHFDRHGVKGTRTEQLRSSGRVDLEVAQGRFVRSVACHRATRQVVVVRWPEDEYALHAPGVYVPVRVRCGRARVGEACEGGVSGHTSEESNKARLRTTGSSVRTCMRSDDAFCRQQLVGRRHSLKPSAFAHAAPRGE